MAVSPYPVTFLVYDTDNSTVVEGATVYVRNITKKTTLVGTNTTNSSGIAMIDLANLPVPAGGGDQYAVGDDIFMVTYYNDKSEAVKYTVAGDSKDQTLYLNDSPHTVDTDEVAGIVKTMRLRTVIASNTDGSTAYYAKVYDFRTGKLLAHIQLLAETTLAIDFTLTGIGTGGWLIERENNAVLVQAHHR